MNVQTTLEQSVPQRLAQVRQPWQQGASMPCWYPRPTPTFPNTCRLLAGAPVAFGFSRLGRHAGSHARFCRVVGR